MRRWRSIRARFTAWYLVVLAVLLSLLSVGLYAYLSYTLQRNLDEGLVHRAEQLCATISMEQIVKEGRFEDTLGEMVALYTREDGGYRIVATQAIESLVDVAWIGEAFAGTPVLVTVSDDNRELRLYVALLGTPGPSPVALSSPSGPPPPDAPQGQQPPPRAVLAIARPLEIVSSPLAALRGALLIAVPLTLLLSAGGGLFLVRRALKPVDRMIETARDIGETDLCKRVEVSTNDELGRLAATLNDMLARLERAFQRQRQFTDDASHELRSPLSVIEAEASLALRRERTPSDYRDALATISEEASKLNQMVDQLLTLARGDAEARSLAREPVDLAELACETVEAMSPLAEEAGVLMEANAAGPAVISGVPADLRRLLTNLVDNAIRHTPAGGSVDVSVRRIESRSSIEMIVADTGVGIPLEHLPRIFDRFYRVDQARAQGSGGRGLGLAICKQIVETHGGKIAAESVLGEGTRLIVRLPLR
jgi:heavy metal sensor kinase